MFIEIEGSLYNINDIKKVSISDKTAVGGTCDVVYTFSVGIITEHFPDMKKAMARYKSLKGQKGVLLG